jgi:hypothetical protein
MVLGCGVSEGVFRLSGEELIGVVGIVPRGANGSAGGFNVRWRLVGVVDRRGVEDLLTVRRVVGAENGPVCVG